MKLDEIIHVTARLQIYKSNKFFIIEEPSKDSHNISRLSAYISILALELIYMRVLKRLKDSRTRLLNSEVYELMKCYLGAIF